jgi:hypothetical protein
VATPHQASAHSSNDRGLRARASTVTSAMSCSMVLGASRRAFRCDRIAASTFRLVVAASRRGGDAGSRRASCARRLSRWRDRTPPCGPAGPPGRRRRSCTRRGGRR